ncbi:signal transduction histidine kinase [Clostridium saccharoperbutylacetonicum]|uniref:histidine kinase n=1 Tax=Clostridium saccharoperbutylacetonicum N1-4(HMT) TaxID=931276 RepID=M1MQD2_9CLOT|nr:HAMP domain-containing sensor histidine kinase [Clostridium saccharoperbutylacetonicum]AGF56951.1 alkaline phosphatase synthesis sensor protein PhoR [Clostridium saccharoperbutylacetonicum N1-4(HMT)]NRT62290.1 signal transduction histidine kinase [Clostridium saccharoperbutylacetonicum]NSB25627.1 signal transduction histidine kinase [Clostridium saccharoperbutylacetonicum]NSB44993.1 signal transduction histidine kinase [Clostridium saccharoperbutylacetonicum]
MDTKLNDSNNEARKIKIDSKNTRKIFIINLIAIILFFTIGTLMVGIYPKIENAGKANSLSFYNYDFIIEDFSKSIYVLYKDALETQQNKTIDVNDIYIKSELKAKDSNEYEVLKKSLNDHLDSWSSYLNNEYRNVDYVVLDKSNNIIKTNTDNTSNTLLNSNDIDNNYFFYVSISFDENGNNVINRIYGVNEHDFRNALNNQFKLNYLFYTDNYNIDKPIKNMTFIYGIGKNLKYNDNSSALIEQGQADAYSNITIIYVSILGGIIVLLSLCIPLKVEKEIIICKQLFKFPFEILMSLVGSLVVIMFIGSGAIVLYTLNSDFVTKGLKQIGIDPNSGNIIVYLSNIIYWSIFSTLILVVIFTFKKIFSISLMKYFKEKTLIGLIIMNAKRNIKKTYENVDNIFENVDIKEKSNKAIEIINSCYRYLNKKIQSLIKRIYTTIFNINIREKSSKVTVKLLGINFIFDLFIIIIFFAGCIIFVNNEEGLILWAFLILIFYNIVLFIFIEKYFTKLRNKFIMLLDATNRIADGKLDIKIEEDAGIFNPFKENLRKIQVGFKKAVDEEVKSQKMKTDLISNVSHDLKTPLTSIITYVDLLKNEDITEDERKSYIDTLDRKSQRLKFLIEDLFEVSKATSGNITLNLVKVDIVELMKQTQIELEDKINNSGLKIKNNFSSNKIILELDSQKTFRIFENLLNNVVKYAMKNSRVYVDINELEDSVEITIKNMSAEEVSFNSFEIVERFQRGDKSRNTEGSGLGLAIVKSFVEAQGGNFNIEVDGDLFKAIIIFKLTK